MKASYPIVLTPDEVGYCVYIPDFDANTQGDSLTDAIEMARDCIGLMGTVLEDDGKPVPEPRPISDVSAEAGEIVSLVDVDFTEYRRKNELRTVKKNCTLPGWLCFEAERANINFSQVLQSALKRELKLAE